MNLAESIIEKILDDKSVIQTDAELRPLVKTYCKMHIAKKIDADLSEFFTEHKHIEIEGYVRFRAAEHIRRINIFTALLLKKQLVKNRYDSFIADMQSYISKNEPLRPLLQLSYKDKQLDLLDEHGCSLVNEARLFYYSEFHAAEEESSDIIFHYLLKVLPARILLYTNGNSNFLKTVQLVFGERIELCNELKY